MLNKTFALASLAMIGQSSKLQAGMQFDECVKSGDVIQNFGSTLESRWSNEVDNNMEIIKNRDSFGADINSIDVCFSITTSKGITGRPITKKRI